MSKVLKVFIVLMLLMSIAAVVLASMLYSNREMLKGRILTHEKYTQQIAQALEYEDLNTADLKNLDRMDAALSPIVAHGQNKILELADTKADLETTRQELAVTTEQLNQTRDELAQTKNRVTNLENTVAPKNAEIQNIRGQVANLEQEKAVLEAETEELEQRLVEADETIEDFRAEVATLERLVDELGTQVDGGKEIFEAEDGTMGRLLAVNEAWNFVVVDLGKTAGLGSGAELLVHRGEEMIGKVRISAVEDDLAIADIVNDWQEEPFAVGDDVVYVVF